MYYIEKNENCYNRIVTFITRMPNAIGYNIEYFLGYIFYNKNYDYIPACVISASCAEVES